MKTSAVHMLSLLLAVFCIGSNSVSAQNVFTKTGDLLEKRAWHTATLLPDGTVLVAGGWYPGTSLASAELYDPATEKWSSTGSLQTARDIHTATLLRNGKVLVVGGHLRIKGKPGSATLASAELYDPASKTWSATESMHTERSFHNATLLPDGKVLVVGGLNQRGNPVSTAEVYDPTIGKWRPTGKPQSHIVTTTLLENGQVLGVGQDPKQGGGQMNPNPSQYAKPLLPFAELYNPTTGIWNRTGNPLIPLDTPNEGYYTTTLLGDGNVLLAGFYATRLNSYPPVRSEVYSSTSGKWTETGKDIKGSFGVTNTLLPDGCALIFGGKYPYIGRRPPNGPFNPIPVTEMAVIYEAKTGGWINAGTPAYMRFHHTATLLPNGKVLIAGGETNQRGGGVDDSAELYDAPLAGHGKVPQR